MCPFSVERHVVGNQSEESIVVIVIVIMIIIIGISDIRSFFQGAWWKKG
jgi:hypothetical protein